MNRTVLTPWALAVVLLVAPTALQAQGQGSDSTANNSAKKAREAEVICRDGTTGPGAQGCANHGGVDAVTTGASQTGRVEHPVETGAVDSTRNPSGGPRISADTGIRVKPDIRQPDQPHVTPDVMDDTTRAPSDSTN
jgi:hypothetical protein